MPFLRNLILPTIALGLIYVALLARITRATMLEVLSQDYVRTAKAKGVGQREVLFVHALKNAAVPIVTIIGIGVALLIGGAVITESVFAIPGLGRLTVDAILRRDYPVIQGVVLLFSFVYVLVNLARRSALHPVRSEDPLLMAGTGSGHDEGMTVLAMSSATTTQSGYVAAPALADVLPPPKQRGRVMTFVYRNPTIVIGGTLLVAHDPDRDLRAVSSARWIPPRWHRPSEPANRRRNTGSAPTCWGAMCIRA